MSTTPTDAAETETAPSSWRRVQSFLRSLALLLSIVGGAAAAGGGLIYLWVEDLRPFAGTVLVIGGLLLLLALISSLATVRAALTGQRGRYTVNALIMVVVALTLAVLLNFISYRSPLRLDTTFTRHFTLAPQTLTVLGDLTEPVRATAFFVPAFTEVQAATRQRAEDLLSEFQRRSQRRFTYRFSDPERDPGTAAQYNVTEYPVIVFEAMESERIFPLRAIGLAEQDLTSSLLVVTGKESKVVYFLTGHGEKDPRDQDGGNATGFGFATRGVFNDNYLTASLNLSQDPAMPKDAAAVVIAGPQRDLQRAEAKELRRWMVEDSGRVLFLIDPGVPITIRELLAEWGIVLGGEFIVDLASSVHQAPRTPLLQSDQFFSAPDEPRVTNELDVVFMPNATPIGIRDDLLEDPRKIPPWLDFSVLAVSTGLSFATEDPDRDTFDQGEDTLGPHPLVMAVQACAPLEEETDRILTPTEPRRCIQAGEETTPTSILVIGDSDFASNRNFYAYANADLLLNAVNWLAEDFNLISIRPKPLVFRELVVTTSEFNLIRYSSWFLLPAAVALGGLFTWWRRR